MTLAPPADPFDPMLGRPPSRSKRLVIVVRADPVICGHSGEARNLAEVARTRGYDDVRIVTWPIDALEASGLPLKPLDRVLPYSPGIEVERPAPVGDYKVPDGRHAAGIVGRLVELFTDGVPTVVLSLYLMPHAMLVQEALRVAHATGLPVDVETMAEAVGSDITNVVRSCLDEERFGAAAHVIATFLAHDHCLAVSAYTKELIVDAARAVDAVSGTSFAERCERQVRISYPAIDARAFTDLSADHAGRAERSPVVRRAVAARGLETGRYVLFLSRLTDAKGVDDLIDAYAASAIAETHRLVVAGTGPKADELRARAAATAVADRIDFFDDVGDEEKRSLMAGSGAYVLASKPRPEFVETFGIALVEKMLAGGGPVITTPTGGIPEAVGDTALVVPPADPVALTRALDRVAEMDEDELAERELAARAYALQFDRGQVFDALFATVGAPTSALADVG